MIGNVLQFTSIPAKIDISSVSAKLSSTYIPSKLDIEKTPAELEIHSKNITCDIDSSECMAEEGHKTTDMLIKEYADQGLQSLQEYAHNLAVEGDMLIHAGKGEDVYKELAGQYLEADIQEPGIKFIPSERPKITWNKN
ncbi:MAG TPA: DUF6470 family protein, partial [Ruminiclostridium sp.]|nr:DUF6470 family protein [Ruminiclostridium sp.]